MIALNFDNVKLSFGVDVILENIAFSINEGDKLGIVGVNGAGKTTLFRLITGEYKADAGSSVNISKDKTIGILDQNLNFTESNTIMDEILLTFEELITIEKRLEQMHSELENGNTAIAEAYASLLDKFTYDGGYEFRGRCKGILKNLGFTEEFWDLRISSLSGGQKTRLALARLLINEPDILMLDEPTNHLDMNALYWLESFLKTYRKTVLIISHDRYFLDSITNKILEVENKKSKLYNGNYTQYMTQKSADREIQEKHYKNQQKEIKRMKEMIDQFRRWGTERSHKIADTKQRALDRIERVERVEAEPDSIRLSFNKSGESGNDVLMIRRLSKAYPNNILFKDINIDIFKREHAFIIGDNGCGKSTLIKIIAGKMEPDDGKIEYGYNVKVGYYDQENQELEFSNTVIDELWNEYSHLTQTEIRNALALFLFKGDDINKPVSVLSGGERARLTLTKLILAKMNLLILDEPTNHLDINSREALEKALLNFDGTIIAVSHDRYFINKLSTRILDFNAVEPYKIYDYKDNYSEYIEYKNNYLKKSEVIEQQNDSKSKEEFLNNKKMLSEKRKLETKIRRTQDEIHELESQLVVIDEEIDGDAASDYKRLAELSDEKETVESRLLELYEILEEITNE
jgi:ATPase components of ABC transporters with duplicated ATPase domains